MREFFRACAVLGLAAIVLVRTAEGQSLERVTVRSFTLSADTVRPRAGAPFHLVVTLRVREHVADVRNLQLPLLAGLQVLGDTRTVSATAQGTLYREIVTVSGSGGATTIPPATFDAIDARDGKAKEYSTNSLALRVVATTQPYAVLALARTLIVVGVALVLLGIFLIVRARREVVVRLPEPVPEPEHAPTMDDLLCEARETLARDPTRRGALRARNAVRRMVGASDGETLADVIDRAAKLDPRLLSILPALERAAFTDDEDLVEAIAGANTALRNAAG